MSKRQQHKQSLQSLPPPIPDEPWHATFRAYIAENEWFEREGRERVKRREDLRKVLKELAQGRNAPFELDGYRVFFVNQSKTYTKPCAACPTAGQSEKRLEPHIKTERMIPTAPTPNAA
jgi:hypothetical protein